MNSIGNYCYYCQSNCCMHMSIGMTGQQLSNQSIFPNQLTQYYNQIVYNQLQLQNQNSTLDKSENLSKNNNIKKSNKLLLLLR